MTKTNKQFEKRPRDFYPTPMSAVKSLKGLLPDNFSFCEPCAGAGDLVRHIEAEFERAVCFLPVDIEPKVDWVVQGDALNIGVGDLEYCDIVITNPPFTWSVVKPMMDHFIPLIPTVLLLPADFAHNVRFAPYLKQCAAIKSIGRIKWIEDSKNSGVENYSWYFFSPQKVLHTEFIGRTNVS